MGTIQKFALVLFTLPDGRIVLQRRTKDAPYAPGLLGTFGGWVEEGETVDQCLLRELNEETSLDSSSLDFALITNFVLPASEDFSKDRHFYLYQSAIDRLDFEVYEGDSAEAFTLSELMQRSDLTYGVRYIVEHILTKE